MADKTPPLRATHAERGASFTGFGGWEMPVEFDSISTEHRAVRNGAGIFDVSHMGEIELAGPDATELVQRLTTNDVTTLAPGEAQYTAITREDGVMLDDTVVYRLSDAAADRLAGSDRTFAGADSSRADGAGAAYLFVPNAGNDGDAYERWVTHRDERDLDVAIHNATREWAMVALQGPDAAGIADERTDADLSSLDRFDATVTSVAGVDCWLARTGYTGEDGVEILCPWDAAETVWAAFDDVQPCGLGARDTLRIEQGFLLSGQDFHPEEEPHTPYEAGIGFVVALDTPFVGRDALATQHADGPTETFVGLRLEERGIARHGYEITHDGATVGRVTSGTKVPTQEQAVALGYLPTALAEPDTEVAVVVRGQEKRARVVTPPFESDNP